jgi:hypothetical protein
MGRPLASSVVLQRLVHEEVEKRIAPSMVSINALVAGRKKTRDADAVPSAYASGSNDARKAGRVQQRQDRRPTPYATQQAQSGSGPTVRKVCDNTFCETPLGHVKDDCFSYGGGKAGKYPEGFRGRRDVHLAPEARIAARRKQALEGRGKAGDRFVGMAEYTEDGEAEVEEVFGRVEDSFAFMMTLREEEDDEDEIDMGEEVHVHAVVCSAQEQDNSVNHDTGASRHIFNRIEAFHDYSAFDSALTVHGFGTNLTTQAVGKGRIVMRATYDGAQRNFSISNALHIPTARCNLISGSRLDKKGVSTQTGNGKITYFNSASVPFASGSIVRDLYKMDVEVVEASGAGGSEPSATVIAAMPPSVETLFGSNAEDAQSKERGFGTV